MEKNIIKFEDNSILRIMFGVFHKNLEIIEKKLNVVLAPRGNIISINGNVKNILITKNTLSELYESAKVSEIIEKKDVESIILNMKKNNNFSKIFIKTPQKEIYPRTNGQSKLIKEILNKEIVFVIGPAGTGKTFISVSHAVSMLTSGFVDKIIVSRPAVEAGEKLGFLPGDLKDKVDPFLRPIYDALYEMMPYDQVEKKIINGVIEIAPIAFMRGRTLEDCYIILDEAQNTTLTQMKMFLTRLGKNSKMVIAGDKTQVDLISKKESGLNEAEKKLKNIKDIGFIYLDQNDVVRNELVQKIIAAYEKNS